MGGIFSKSTMTTDVGLDFEPQRDTIGLFKDLKA